MKLRAGTAHTDMCSSNSARSVSTRATRAAALDKLEKLDDAKKIKVVMEHNGTTVSQTLVLNSYNSENAEYGLRSEKLQLASRYLHRHRFLSL